MLFNNKISKALQVATLASMCAYSQLPHAFEPFTVKKIHVRGTKQVSKDAVLVNMPVKVGSKVHPYDTADIIHELHESGLFETVSLYRSGDILVVEVTERPVIKELNIKGIKHTKEAEEVLRDFQVAKGYLYDSAKVDLAIDAIEKKYIGKGKYSVTVEKATKQVDGGMEVTLSIYEGGEAKIKDITFAGNKSFKDKQLLDALIHKKSHFFSWYTKDDIYVRGKLHADIEGIKSFYMDRGYLNVDIQSAKVSLSPDRKSLFLNFRISEGDIYSFGKVGAKEVPQLSQEEIRATLEEKKLLSGKTFSRKLLSEAQEELKKKLGAKGYSKADVQLDFVPNEAKKTIDISFIIKPGKRVMVRNITFNGNTLTRDDILRNKVKQYESTWISTTEVEQGREAIERSGLATGISVDVNDVPGKDDQVDVNYKLEEQKTTKFTAGVNYSSADGFMFNLSAELSNFLGTGNDINVVVERSRSFDNYSIGYYNPHFYDYNLGMGYNIYYNKSELSKTSKVYEYTSHAKGGNVYWTYPTSRFDRLVVELGYDFSKLVFGNRTDEPLEITNFVNAEGTRFKQSHIAFSWQHNSLNKYIFPSEGMKSNFAIKYMMPFSDLKYYKLDYTSSYYRPLVGDLVLNTKAAIGYANTFGKTRYIPFYRHYFTGGADSVRGFEERSLGPKDSKGKEYGGNVLFNLRTQLITPPPFMDSSSSVRLGAFVDVGQVYDTIIRTRNVGGVTQNRNPRGIRASAGLSVTWYTPMGMPLEVSFAKPLKRRNGDDLRFTSFSFGFQF